MAQTKPWGGRFKEATDRRVARFSASVEDDQHIALDDVAGSLAHARMLKTQGLISAEDESKLIDGLENVEKELTAGTFPWREELEDVHMNIETRLGELVGADVAGRLHTARSRNDQVALDTRLYIRRRLLEIHGYLIELEGAFLDQARAHLDTFVPGYTHLQRGQPVRLAHHLLAYREMFARDRVRIQEMLVRTNLSPLGAGAMAGSPHPIDRDFVAHQLGFSGVTKNSMDTVADRDHLAEAIFMASLSMIHLSRFSEEVVMWASAEFAFVEVRDAFSTGSSMMPQKKNPDVAELVRGKCGRVVGDLMALLMTVKSLPLTYNRDLQEDKPPLYDALNTWADCVAITAAMIPALDFNKQCMEAALDQGFVLATELADYLVTKNVPFRDAHHVAGRIVGDCVNRNCTLSALNLDDLKAFSPAFDEDVKDWLQVEKAVDRRDIVGGPARDRVRGAIHEAEDELQAAADWSLNV